MNSLSQVLLIFCFPQVVEWLLGVVNHLPSEDQCQKCLVAPVDDKEKHDDMMLGRTKCYDLVTKVGTNQNQENIAVALSIDNPLRGLLCQKTALVTVAWFFTIVYLLN